MEEINWHDYFIYDESSPSCLRWKVDRWGGKQYKIKKISAGDVAGGLDSTGYYSVKLNCKTYRCHRIVFQLCNDIYLSRSESIDHIDGSKVNNISSNLRLVTQAVNSRNSKKQHNNTSGVTGVYKTVSDDNNSYWRAGFCLIDGRRTTKNFPIHKHGDEEAFRLACRYREEMIAKLNKQGAGYTERHGN